MAEPNAVMADPISSDGSEDSWILLDEMDEAMNDVDSIALKKIIEKSEIVDQNTLSASNEPHQIENASEAVTPIESDENAMSDLNIGSGVEIISTEISTCPSNDEQEDVDVETISTDEQEDAGSNQRYILRIHI